MKIAINTAFGSVFEETKKLRTDPKFIEDIETGRFVGHFNERFGLAEALVIVEIPDEATDYAVLNYDGSEIVAYCYNGKIYFTPDYTNAQRILEY